MKSVHININFGLKWIRINKVLLYFNITTRLPRFCDKFFRETQKKMMLEGEKKYFIKIFSLNVILELC